MNQEIYKALKKQKYARDKVWVERIEKHNLQKRSVKWIMKKLSRVYLADNQYLKLKSATIIEPTVISHPYIGQLLKKYQDRLGRNPTYKRLQRLRQKGVDV